MFSKKPLARPAVQSAPSRLARAQALALTAAQNPYISAGGAGLLFLTTLAVLIMITGDPKAGAPVVRISLAQAAASGVEVPGWREGLAPETDGEATVSTGAAFDLGSTSAFGVLRWSPIPALAQSYTVSPDGLTWTFRLRPSTWSDGRPVTANDFVFALTGYRADDDFPSS